MRRATIAATLALATAACGSSDMPANRAAYVGSHELPHAEPRHREALDPTSGLADLLAATARPAKVRATRGTTRPRPDMPARNSTPGGDGRTVTSTAYCETGVTASGARTFAGSVAMNGVPLGSRWQVTETGAVYTVADRIGHGSQFDIAFPGDCGGARRYGRRTIHVQRVA